MTRPAALSSLLVAIVTGMWGQAQIVSVTNAASSSQGGLPYGGALATAYVSGLADLTAGTYIAPSSQALPNSLGGVQVIINGALAPLLAVVVPAGSSTPIQVNFQVPLERNVPTPPGMTVIGPTATAVLSQLSVPLSAPAWGAFFSDANGYAAALHASDLTPVTTQSPAQPGESIITYADDLFTTWPPPPIGIPVPPQVSFQIANFPPRNPGYLYLQAYPQYTTYICPTYPFGCLISVTNTPALQITFEGLAPGRIGVEEIDFVVPADQQPGNWPLFINIGSCPDGSGAPGKCGTGSLPAESGPYVLLPVGPSSGPIQSIPYVSSIADKTTDQSCNIAQNSSCTLNVSQNDILQITGIGFSPAGGNIIQLTGPGGDWYLYEQDGVLFSDSSRTQITSQVACYLPPGPWTLNVMTPPAASTNPAAKNTTPNYSINIAASPSCQ